MVNAALWPLKATAVALSKLVPVMSTSVPGGPLPGLSTVIVGFIKKSVALVFYPLVVTWICDSAAMFAGQRLGGRKLWPSVSPGKTWSGSTAGLVAALLVAPLYQRLVLQPAGLDVPLLPLLVVAALVGVLGQLGDLVESLFKREVGVKDSSSLIPGHGGVLDRLDSLYVVVPLAAACFRWLGVP